MDLYLDCGLGGRRVAYVDLGSVELTSCCGGLYSSISSEFGHARASALFNEDAIYALFRDIMVSTIKAMCFEGARKT